MPGNYNCICKDSEVEDLLVRFTSVLKRCGTVVHQRKWVINAHTSKTRQVAEVTHPWVRAESSGI